MDSIGTKSHDPMRHSSWPTAAIIVQLAITAAVLALGIYHSVKIADLRASLPQSLTPAGTSTNWAFDCSAVLRLPPQTSPAPTWDINLVTLAAVSLGNGAYALVDGTRQET
jgi:hypothetical protein